MKITEKVQKEKKQMLLPRKRDFEMLYCQLVLLSNTKVLSNYYQLQASHELNLFVCIKGTSLRFPSGAWQKWISGHGAQVSEIVCTL